MSFRFGKALQSRYFKFSICHLEILPNGPSGPRRFCGVRAFCRRQNLGGGMALPSRAFQSPKGGDRCLWLVVWSNRWESILLRSDRLHKCGQSAVFCTATVIGLLAFGKSPWNYFCDGVDKEIIPPMCSMRPLPFPATSTFDSSPAVAECEMPLPEKHAVMRLHPPV